MGCWRRRYLRQFRPPDLSRIRNERTCGFVRLLKASFLVKSENLTGGGKLPFGALQKVFKSAPNQPFVV
jgi:hypothetical protein